MARGSKIKKIEEFPRRIKIFVTVLILMLVFGTISFYILSENSISDSFHRTLKTLAFMFDDDSTTAERYIEIFFALVGVFIVWWVLWSIADMILDGNLAKYLKTRYYSIKIKQMKDHVIIIGGGRMGEEIAKSLELKKTQFIIIESDSKVVNLLRSKNYTVIEGDATIESNLNTAEIMNASKIILTLPKTELNIMLTLTVKELNPKIEVYSRCEKHSQVSKLKKAGAKEVIVPEIIAGDKIIEDLKI